VFLGKHDRQLDDKGRLAIPAEYVRHIGTPDGPKQVVLTPGRDGCLRIFTRDDFEARAPELAAQFVTEVEDEFFQLCQLRDVDKAGRVLVDETARELAGLPDPATADPPVQVVVAGSGRYIQVWRKDRHQVRASPASRFAEKVRP
jgi:DNA-binding transcriptional regulator/RsmH inhibitor MraZ